MGGGSPGRKSTAATHTGGAKQLILSGTVTRRTPSGFYYLEEAQQEPQVQAQLAEIRKQYADLTPEQIKVIDPCCGSGHILAYLFDVLMQIYENYGYTPRDAVTSILQNNLYGLDIDDRAAQMAYFCGDDEAPAGTTAAFSATPPSLMCMPLRKATASKSRM